MKKKGHSLSILLLKITIANGAEALKDAEGSKVPQGSLFESEA